MFQYCVTCPMCAATSVRGLLERGRDHPEDGVHKSGDDGKILQAPLCDRTLLPHCAAFHSLTTYAVIRTSPSCEWQGSP
jgi:hypothetical protein